MGREIKGKLALDISPWSRSLATAQRELNRTIAQIERESKQSLVSMRADMLGGLGGQGNQSLQEMRAFLQEQKAAARTAKESFDAQAGGGMFGASMTKFNPALAEAKAGFTDLIAKAWAAKEAIHSAFLTGSAIVNTFRGNIDAAKDALAKMPMTGWLNQAGMDLGTSISDWANTNTEGGVKGVASGAWTTVFGKDSTTYKQRAEQLKEAEDQAKRNKYVAEQNRKTAEFEAETRRMLRESANADASSLQQELSRVQQFREDQAKALQTSGMSKDSPQYAARQRAIDDTAGRMEYAAYVADDKRKADEQAKVAQEQAKALADQRKWIADARNETLALTKTQTELKLIEAERAGLTREQLAELKAVLDQNEKIRESQKKQREEAEKQKRLAEEQRQQREREKQAAEQQRQRDAETVQHMMEEASPELKFAVDKGELDRLKADLGMDDKTYNFQLNKLKDELKKNLGIDLDKGKMPNQGTMESTRTGMLTYALMGGKADEEKSDRKQMLEYQRIIAEAARNQGRLGFNN